MWYLPPHKGHRVALNPESPYYERYNRNQARNDKGFILSDHGNAIRNWVNRYRDNYDSIEIEVRWDNGHANLYKLRDLLPLTSDEIFYELRFVGGDNTTLPEKEVEAYLNERLIKNGRQLRSKEVLGFDNKDRAYKTVATDLYNKVTTSGTIDTKDTQLIEALASHGYGLQKYEKESKGEAISGFTVDTQGVRADTAFGTIDLSELRAQIDQMTTQAVTQVPRPEPRQAYQNDVNILDELFTTRVEEAQAPRAENTEGIMFRRVDTDTF